jgi:hypothetical protein
MPRSASTWQYQVVCHLLEQFRDGIRGGFLERPEDFARLAEQTAGRAPWVILKTHNGFPPYAEALRDGRAFAVYSYRDIRDVAFSLTHKLHLPFNALFEKHLLAQCIKDHEFWTSLPNVLSQRYETIVEAPADCVLEIAEFLGLRLSRVEAEKLAAAYSLEANRARARRLEQQLQAQGVALDDPRNAVQHDEHSQLHWNHIRTGRVGGWRDEATPRQIALLAAMCNRWLIDNEYEPDDNWALPGLQYLWDLVETLRLQVEQEHDQFLQTREELDSLLELGPVALDIAREIHWAVRRFPGIARPVKQVARKLGVNVSSYQAG